MKEKFSIPKNSDNLPDIGELIRQVLEDKGITYQELAEKLQVPVEEVLAYDKFEHAPSIDVLKKMSGILGLRYRMLRISAGYNCANWYPDFYMPDGTEIDHEDILDRIYYKDPSVFAQMYQLLFKD